MFYHSKKSGLFIPNNQVGSSLRRNPSDGGGGALSNTKSIETYGNATPDPRGTYFQDLTMSPSSQRKGTLSAWFNPLETNTSAALRPIGMNYADSGFGVVRLISFELDPTNETIGIGDTGGGWSVLSAGAAFTNIDAWYHMLAQVDTTQATEANRVKLFLDGVEVSYSSPTYPAQNTNLWGFNDGTAFDQVWGTAISGQAEAEPVRFDEIAFFDGQTYGYSDVASGGVPKDLAGLTFGNMGFWHRFETGVAATVGNDSSGNGFNFANGGSSSLLIAAAFADADFKADVPT